MFYYRSVDLVSFVRTRKLKDFCLSIIIAYFNIGIINYLGKNI